MEEKKEIWTLIQYLYECGKENIIPPIHCEDLMNLEFLRPFVKWLFDNNKLDFMVEWNSKYLEYPIWSNNYDEIYGYKDIIERLSVSDTLIDDLIYYLK